MARIVGLAGSLRTGSFNAALLRAAAELAPEGSSVEIASLRGVPLYDGDVEAKEGLPDAVVRIKEAIASSDGLLLATPEYNGSIPGVLKNAVDWLSRPPKDIGRVFGGRAVGLVGATPGRAGTRLAQAAWLPIFRALGLRPWFGGSLYLAGAGDAFDAEGRLADDKIRELVRAYMGGLTAFARPEP